MLQIRRIPLPDSSWCLAIGPDGAISVEVTDQGYLDGPDRLLRFDPDGQLLWEHTLPCPIFWPRMRVAPDGAAWTDCGDRLLRFAPDGSVTDVLQPPWRANEQVGSFLLLPDGYLVCSRREHDGEPGDPRVLRYDRQHRLVWDTSLPVLPISFPHRPETSWLPENWNCHYEAQPLVLLGDCLLVSFLQISNGLGLSYVLDAATGALRWTTPSYPLPAKAIAGPGQFLFSSHGYGLADIYLYDRDGNILQHWPRGGNPVVSPSGAIFLQEVDGVIPPESHVSILEPDGTIQTGPPVDGLHATYPVLTHDDRLVYWCRHELVVVDRNLERQVLYVDDTVDPEALISRMLLTDQGRLVFTVGRELWLVDTELGPLARSPWPCGAGNLAGNPVR